MNALKHQYLLSEYDATAYYFDSIYMIVTQNTIIPKLNWTIADPGFHVLLYWLGKIYINIFQIKQVTYFHFILFLIFLHSLTFLYMYIELERKKLLTRATSVVFFLFVLFEPMMLRFSATLEREIVVSLLLLFFIIGYMENNFLSMAVYGFILYFFREIYLYFIPFLFFIQIVHKRFFKGHFFIFLILMLFTFPLVVDILSSFSKEMEHIFFVHGKERGLSGFGDLILGSGYFFRVLLYSILGFVAPIPIYPFFDSSYSTFYVLAFIMGLGSISYFFMNTYIIFSLGSIDKKNFKLPGKKLKDNMEKYYPIFKAYIAIIVLHFVFHGLIFNVRHRLQIIPPLIFIFFHVFKIMSDETDITQRVSIGKCLLASISITALLNFLYFVIKLKLIFEAGIILMCLMSLLIIMIQRNLFQFK